MTEESQLNRVLLPRAGFMRPYQGPEGEDMAATDLSGLQFIVEELLALAAVEVAIAQDSIAVEAIPSLASTIRDRLVLVDSQRSLQQADALFAPLAEEFVTDYGKDSIGFKPGVSSEVVRAVGKIYFDLPNLLLAVNHKLVVSLDLDKLRNSISFLRREYKNPDARANLAILEGILKTYDTIKTPALVWRPSASENQARAFAKFVEDETYRQISRTAHGLGFPQRLRRAISGLERLIRDAVAKAPFQQIFTFGSQIVSAATSVPIPTTDTIESLLKDEYLPPIVSLDRALARAEAAWEKAKTELVFVSKVKDDR